MATMTGLMITDKSNKATGWISEVDANNVLIRWEDEREEELTNEELESLLESDGYSVETKEMEIDEDAETPAAASLHTHSQSEAGVADDAQSDGNPKTRLDWILRIVGNLGQMDMESLARYDQRTVDGFVGGEGDKAGVGGNSVGNKNSLNMKPSAAEGSVQGAGSPAMAGLGEAVLFKLQKEEQDSVFGEMDLTEEAKSKITTLFEAAVSLRVAAETVKIQEASTKAMEESMETFSDKMVEALETYSEFCVKEFMENNKLEIISELRTELTGEFIDGLKNLFLEHNIDIPEDKVDVLEAITSENEALKRKVDELTEGQMNKEKSISELKKKEVLSQVSEGLTLMQKTKLTEASKTIVFETEESFKTKLDSIKKAFISEKSTPESNIDGVKKELSLVEGKVLVEGVEELKEEDKPEENKFVDPRIAAAKATMNRYAS